jgi:hypothetical protein
VYIKANAQQNLRRKRIRGTARIRWQRHHGETRCAGSAGIEPRRSRGRCGLGGDKLLERGSERGSKRPASHGESADGATGGGEVARGVGAAACGAAKAVCVVTRALSRLPV